MAEPDHFSEDVLVGHDAVAWLQKRRRFGPQLLDQGLAALGDSFDRARPLSAFVPSLGPPGLRRDFFLAVTGDIESDEDWERLIDAYQLLDQHSRDALDDARYRRERSAFNLVLWADPPSPVMWDELQERWFSPQ